MRSVLSLLAALLILVGIGTSCAVAAPEGFAKEFTYKQSDGAVDVLSGDKVIARYVYKDTAKPYIYPLTSPAGLQVTRSFPMKKIDGEPTDHPHQKSMWIGYGDANGQDFWAETEKSGKIVQTSIDFEPISPGPYWSIHTTNDWIRADGTKACADERKIAFYSCKYGVLIVTQIRLIASEAELDLNDSKEGFVGIRLAPALALKGGTGHILNSAGDKDDKAWGKRARWIDYTGQIGDKTVGVAMFDSTRNYGYPTYWHARDYGLLAANPFGGKAFSGDAKNDSGLKITYTDSIALVYTTLIHDGKLDPATLDTLANEVGGSVPKPPEVDGPRMLPGRASAPPKPADAPATPSKPAEAKSSD